MADSHWPIPIVIPIPKYIEMEGNRDWKGIIFEAIWNFHGEPKSESEAGSVNGP